jgi:rhodanese-related sulfurtransferase/DNA-binding MarR family transcriptional regulator
VINQHRTALLAEFARVGKALSNPSRLALLELLAQAEHSVEGLAVAAGLAIGNTSAQLQVLRNTGLVETRRDGTRVYYRLAGDDIAALYASLHQVARNRSAAVESIRAAYLSQEGPVRPVTREELVRLTAAGEATVLDVRPSVEYENGHLPDALSIPLDELQERLDSLPKDREIVAYCRGTYCLLAGRAVHILRRNDLPARPLEMGMIEWRLADLPVEREPASASRDGP